MTNDFTDIYLTKNWAVGPVADKLSIVMKVEETKTRNSTKKLLKRQNICILLVDILDSFNIE